MKAEFFKAEARSKPLITLAFYCVTALSALFTHLCPRHSGFFFFLMQNPVFFCPVFPSGALQVQSQLCIENKKQPCSHIVPNAPFCGFSRHSFPVGFAGIVLRHRVVFLPGHLHQDIEFHSGASRCFCGTKIP